MSEHPAPSAIELRANEIIAEAKQLAKAETERLREYGRVWSRALPEIVRLELNSLPDRAEQLIAHIKAQKENLESIEATRVGKLIDAAALKLLSGVGTTIANALAA